MSQIDVSQQDGSLIITLPTRFDSHIIDSFREAYCSIPGDSDLKYVIDLAQTEYIDSSALGMLLNFKHHSSVVKLRTPQRSLFFTTLSNLRLSETTICLF